MTEKIKKKKIVEPEKFVRVHQRKHTLTRL